MLGWIYFIASCYIVTTLAKLIHKGINCLALKAIRFFSNRKAGQNASADTVKEAGDVH